MPRTSRELSIFPITLREVTVRRIEDLTPHLRRVTVGGPDMGAGIHDGHPVPAFRSDGFDDHVKLVIPTGRDDFGEVGVQDGERFDWAPGALGRTRDYTVRRVRDDELELDFVVHEGGLAADWALRVAVGDPLRFAGPKTSATVSREVDWHLLIADETALPAVARWLEEAPAGTRAIVVLEVPSVEDRLDLPTRADAAIHWLVRPEGVAPGYSTQLAETVRALDLPTGRGYAWCAGETLTIAPIRRHLRTERGLRTEDVEVNGYWRRTSHDAARVAGSSAAVAPATEPEATRPTGSAPDPAPATGAGLPTESEPDLARAAGSEPEPARSTAPADARPPSPSELARRLHDMTELLPPVVVRVATTLGIPALLAEGTDDAIALAGATGIPIERLSPLLDALEALELVARAGDRLRLTALGEVLLEESAQDTLDLDDPLNRIDLSLLGLLDTLRTGRGGRSDAPTRPLSTWRSADPELRSRLHDASERALLYNLAPLLAVPEIRDAEEIVVIGDGTVPTAAALVRERPERRVTLRVPSEDAEETGRRLSAAPPPLRARISVEVTDAPTEVPDGGTLLLQLALDTADDARYAALVGSGGRTLVAVAALADEARADDDVAAEALTALAATGVPLRTGDRHTELLARLGHREVRITPLGWGFGPSLIIATR